VQPGLCHVTGIWQISFQNWLMKAHWQTYVMCLFFRHLDYFAAILEAKKILPTLYYGPRASPGQKICCSLAEWPGPGSFMLALGGPGCKSAGPCHLYRKALDQGNPKWGCVSWVIFERYTPVKSYTQVCQIISDFSETCRSFPGEASTCT